MSASVENAVDIVTEKALTWPERAKAVRIDSSETYRDSADLLMAIKQLRNEVNEAFDPIIAAAHQTHKTACDRKRRAEAPLVEAEVVIKRALVTYTDAQTRIRRAEQVRLQEAQRLADETRRIEEAAALEREAQATGDVGLQEQATAILETPAPVIVVQPQTPPPPAVQGLSYRETFRAEVTSLPTLVEAVAARQQPITLLLPNQSALDGLARALKTALAIPGVRLVTETTPVTRTR